MKKLLSVLFAVILILSFSLTSCTQADPLVIGDSIDSGDSYIKGNIHLDGSYYGDGSHLTGLSGGSGDMEKSTYDPDEDGVIEGGQVELTASTVTDILGLITGDGSNLDYIALSGDSSQFLNGTGVFSTPSVEETDPVIKAIDGIIKSNTTTISAATAGTDYVKPGTSTNGNVLLASGYNVDVVASLTSDHSWSGITMTYTAGEDLIISQPVYLKFSDGKVYKANSTDSTTMPCIGIATTSISQNATGTILMWGSFRDDTWDWSSGNIYVSTTAGNLTQTAPSSTGNIIQLLGIALTADIILVSPNYILIEHK